MMMRHILMTALLIMLMTGCLSAKRLPPLTTVNKVDLNRYTGLWYQFAYFPNSFQSKNAVLTTAEYGFSPKGYITVRNSEYEDRQGKKLKSDINGKAFVVDKTTKSRLAVQFFWPFKAPYWIIMLDEKDYQWAVVSDPKRKFLWVLSRKPAMDREFYESLLSRIEAKHIDTDKIVVTGWFE